MKRESTVIKAAKALRFLCLLAVGIILTTYLMSVALDAMLYELDSRPAPSVGYPVSQSESRNLDSDIDQSNLDCSEVTIELNEGVERFDFTDPTTYQMYPEGCEW